MVAHLHQLVEYFLEEIDAPGGNNITTMEYIEILSTGNAVRFW